MIALKCFVCEKEMVLESSKVEIFYCKDHIENYFCRNNNGMIDSYQCSYDKISLVKVDYPNVGWIEVGDDPIEEIVKDLPEVPADEHMHLVFRKLLAKYSKMLGFL
jgi:hypothetical protein